MNKKRSTFILILFFSFLVGAFSMLSSIHADDVTSVKNWNELSTALKDKKTNIKVTNTLDATSNLNINVDTTIDFNNQNVNMNNRNFSVQQGVESVNIKNLNFIGTYASGYLFRMQNVTRVTPVVTFNGNLESRSGNVGKLINNPNGQVILDGVTANIADDTNTNGMNAMIVSKKFNITNGSNVKSNTQRFYHNDAIGGEVLIDGNSNVTTNGMKGGTNGQIWQILAKTNFTVSGSGTKLVINGNGTQTASTGALFIIGANDSNINIANGAKWIINSQNCSGIILQSEGGTFNVTDESTLDINQYDDNGYNIGAALRFRSTGNMTFNVKNKSRISINKKGGSAAALRMRGGNNTVNISGNSDFIVKNIANAGSNASNYSAIQFESGNNNNFNITGDSSNVEVTSTSGPAINAQPNTVSINAGEKTYFVARGNTPANTGIFANTGNNALTFSMNKVNYYDFQNTGKGNVISSNGRNSSFKSVTSDIDAWKIGSDVSKEPTNTWHSLSYELNGPQFDNIVSASDSTFNKDWLGMANYSRISGNNQPALVDKLSTPTDADKSIYAYAYVPQGKYEDLRPAYTNEVKAKILVSKNSKKLFDAETTTQTTNDYNNTNVQGILKFVVPNNEFLIENSKVEITSAVRESNNSAATNNTTAKMVQAVQPPKAPTLDSDKYGVNVKNIKGSAEKNLNVFLLKNNVNTGIKTTTDENGDFDIDTSNEKFSKDDKLQIILQDNKGAVDDVTNPPSTNSSIGNIQPENTFKYHDADFTKGIIINLSGELAWGDKFNQLNFGDQKISTADQLLPAQENINEKMSVNDSRGTGSTWSLTVKGPKYLENSGKPLKANLLFKNNGHTPQIISENETLITEHKTISNDDNTIINENWNDNDTGIFLNIPGNANKYIGKYHGNVEWILKNVPN